MINIEEFNKYLKQYKTIGIKEIWPGEFFKWRAVQCFQDNWNLDATDLADMMNKSFAKTESLLNTRRQYSASMIIDFAKKGPDEVRQMFIDLFDETKDYYDRMENFKEKSKELLIKYHPDYPYPYQNENAISTYLWLRYPDKYCIYKPSVLKTVCLKLDPETKVKSGDYKNNIAIFLEEYNELSNLIVQDKELIDLLHSQLPEDCYKDPMLKTLTIDVAFYISNHDLIETIGIDPITQDNKYSKEQFLQEVYISKSKYDRMVATLRRKMNIILQGAPGVGKTFAAKRLAYSLIGEKNDDQIELIQFHQNYSYEDFMMGYKPEEEKFVLKYGVFYRFCKLASEHPDQEYFFIIDEINRGNMSKIFGELLMLIEKNYRDTSITLAYKDIEFNVPGNLYIIGMMNTADRSLAMIDYALRRRFSFIDMEPAFESDGFIKHQQDINNPVYNALINQIKELNRDITNDSSLGKGFCIGHSYFCNQDSYTKEELLDIVDYDIIPMLEEYWFDNEDKVQMYANRLHGVFE